MKLYKKIWITLLILLFVLFASLFASVAFAANPWQSAVDSLHEPAIVGGEEAAPTTWPWMVALVRSGQTVYNGQFCGGSLIHPQYVLTAAHCTYTQDSPNSAPRPISPSEVFVVVGDYRLSDAQGQRIQVKQIIRHPGYDGMTEDNDVALFELETPANPANPINVVGAIPGDLLNEGRMSMVIGWGLTIPGNNSSFPDVLRQVEVPLVSLSACWDAYGMINGAVTENMLCAGLIAGGKDSCQGDSGGPLMTFDEAAQLWKQTGIVSWGTGCAEPKYYGVYTNLSKYASWIAEQIPVLNTPVPSPTSTATSSPTATATPTNTATQTPLATAVTATPEPALLYLPVVRRQSGDSQPSATPTTPSGTATATPESLSLLNGDFEQGQSGWRESSVLGQTLIRADGLPTTPHSGSVAVRLLGSDDEVAYVAQRVTIRSEAPFLSYWYQARSSDDCGYDYGGVVINRMTIADSFDLCQSKQQLTWQQRTVDLSAYIGQTVEIALRGETDLYATSELLIDDVSFVAAIGR